MTYRLDIFANDFLKFLLKSNKLCEVKIEDKTFALTNQNKYLICLYILIKGSCSKHGYDEKIQILIVF